MSENKINLVVPKDYNGKPIEVVLREGEAPVALDPKEQERVVINGTIDAPLRWLEKRVELINQKSTNIIVNRDKMGLALTIDETNYYQTGISGILQASKEMQEFGINTDKKWEPVKLSQFFKMHRAFFKDKSENMMLVSTLKNFKAKVNQDIERSKEENGSKTDNLRASTYYNDKLQLAILLLLFRKKKIQHIRFLLLKILFFQAFSSYILYVLYK